MKWKKSLFCIGLGIVFYAATGIVDHQTADVENGILYRSPCGKGDTIYELYAKDSLGHETNISLSVPERKMTEDEFRAAIPEMMNKICEEMPGENRSVNEVRSDLNLLTELSEYGVSVSWRSGNPEIVSRSGFVDLTDVTSSGMQVIMEAILQCGEYSESIEIPIVVYPKESDWEDRFYNLLLQTIQQQPENEQVVLPKEFEQCPVYYQNSAGKNNRILILLGIAAAILLHVKEKNDLQNQKKQREESLIMAYQDLVSNILILTGAGYPPKMAWKKITKDMEDSLNEKKSADKLVLLKEMQMTVNQMETGIPEIRAYADFGRRCGIRCYIRFASLLESSVQTGGKNLRGLLEAEMEEAFRQRADLARKKGEEASSKLLLPLFGMLGIIMIMVAAPAFLSLG